MNIGENKLVLELKSKIKDASQQLMDIVIEESDLVKKGVVIKTEYIIKIGKYEIEKFKLYFEHMKLRRKVELFQAAFNRQEAISSETVNKIIEEETKEYKAELDGLIQDLHTANQIIKSKKVTDEEFKSIKETYRYIVNKIHPDINPEITENSKLLWKMTQEAYLKNDLQQLLLVKSLIENENVHLEKENEIDILDKKLMGILFNIDEVKDHIKKMYTVFPLNKEELLKQNNEVEIIVTSIKKDINLYKQYNADLSMRLQELLSSRKDLFDE